MRRGSALACVAACAAGALALASCAAPPVRIGSPGRGSLPHIAQAASLAASAAVAAAERSVRLDPVPPGTYKNGPRTGPRLIALTFDLCATPTNPYTLDGPVVAALRAKEATATFYMGGLWAQAHPADAAALAAVPFFEIGNHSMTHPRPLTIGDATLRAEVLDAQAAIRDATGRTPLTFRYPFDEYDGRTAAVVGACGLTGVAEDLRTGDPDPNISGKRIAEYVIAGARPGSIVLMHANGNGVHTAEALPALIDGLRAKGFQLATVTEVLGIARTRTTGAP